MRATRLQRSKLGESAGAVDWTKGKLTKQKGTCPLP